MNYKQAVKDGYKYALVVDGLHIPIKSKAPYEAAIAAYAAKEMLVKVRLVELKG